MTAPAPGGQKTPAPVGIAYREASRSWFVRRAHRRTGKGPTRKSGRRWRTYEIFAGSWGTWADPGDSPIWTALNTRPKYVASTTLTGPRWADTTVLAGDLAAAIGELKARPEGELQVHGSGSLVRWLFDHRLVDEITLVTYPVVVGQGTRLFPATGPDTALELVESHATSNGVTMQVYRPSGRPRYATSDTGH